MKSVINTNKMKLALGTVQFGLDYGISNQAGKPSFCEIVRILNTAYEYSIDTLDTASAYGDSELVLGKMLRETSTASSTEQSFNIVTKIPHLSNTTPSKTTSCTTSISEYFDNSLKHLQTRKIDALMFHNANDLLTNEGASYFQQATDLKRQGLVKKIGVSVYQPQQLETIMERFKLDIVQVPFNYLDQRFSQPAIQENLAKQHIEVHVRSLFLQGLLLMPLERLNDYFQPYLRQIQRFHALCKQLKCQPLTLALALIHTNDFIDKAVVGCCSNEQLIQIINHYQRAKVLVDSLTNETFEQLSLLACSDEALINPSLWPVN